MNVITSIVDDSRQVRLANRAGAACSRGTQFPAHNYMDAVGVIANAMQPYYLHNERAEAVGINRRGVAVYLRCFGPAIEAVQREAAARRIRFLADNALAFRAVQHATARLVAKIESQYGVRFGR